MPEGLCTRRWASPTFVEESGTKIVEFAELSTWRRLFYFPESNLELHANLSDQIYIRPWRPPGSQPTDWNLDVVSDDTLTRCFERASLPHKDCYRRRVPARGCHAQK